MPYGITQCYLPPGRVDIPALTPAEAGTRLKALGHVISTNNANNDSGGHLASCLWTGAV